MTKIYQRENKSIIEPKEYQAAWLKRLYQTKWGNVLLYMVTSPLFSIVWTAVDHTRLSKNKIALFVKEYGINLSDYESENYQSFAAFFTRKLKAANIHVSPSNRVCAVAQAKLLTVPIQNDQTFTIKGQNYRLADILQDRSSADYYEGGTLFIYRLAVDDYHRYLASETGTVIHQRKIRGKLHTIREIAQQNFQVFKENKRAYCLIETKKLGTIMQMEVGALLVGKIYNQPFDLYQRGEEKGWFSLGGSTILVAYPKGTVTVDQDIDYYSSLNIETQVTIGEGIGLKIC
ncbi:Phosphatidylserine decarboxylase [Carnobacterium sp. AT7]|uniref:phosphatidylserine decarboxylase n=1 Tax=Carnobacterium sp. AT7 TaxID=333990 RepID=UPI00015F1A99|nr:phosphatidylserine decarboxylase [Carnobacterium sp. AT7]EDP68690.1 Phosphatidylserine decarboxylase [Carnobacterium sp. AT7]